MSQAKDKYLKGRSLGEGTWGQVYEATRESDGLKVAVKMFKVRDLHNGLNFSALREIKFLKGNESPFVIQMVDVFLSDDVLHMVLELCPTDLDKVIKDRDIGLIAPEQTKAYMRMILQGMSYLHQRYILHRDLKPENLLIGLDGRIKIADFGLAREFGSPNLMTSNVASLWYKAPELIFGANHYSAAIDVWSIGCIFAELLWRTPLFPGTNDVEQLQKIFKVLGTPDPDDWPGVDLLKNYVQFSKTEPASLIPLFSKPREDQMTNGIPSSLDLLLRFLALNPMKRISATDALAHNYFQQFPAPAELRNLPVPEKVRHLMRVNNRSDANEPAFKKGRNV